MKNKSLLILSVASAPCISAIISTGCKAPAPAQQANLEHGLQWAAQTGTSQTLLFRPQYLPAFQTARDQLLGLSTQATIAPADIQAVLTQLNIGGKAATITSANLAEALRILGNATAGSTNFVTLRADAAAIGTGIGIGIKLYQTP